ncbi:MAG: hypothetical protein LBV54_05540 [Puniceicoccales bacterium]|jgi:hypothetical protein|nr:hypothetical protein [Puniceicoccales bacterium]
MSLKNFILLAAYIALFGMFGIAVGMLLRRPPVVEGGSLVFAAGTALCLTSLFIFWLKKNLDKKATPAPSPIPSPEKKSDSK